MYKLVACDLDQTLLGDDCSISIENKTAICQAQELGVKFVIATGRGYPAVQNVLADIGMLDEHDEYVISLNGAIITENKNNKVLAFTGMDFDIVRQLFAYGMKYQYDMHIYTEKDVYVYHMDEGDREYIIGRVPFTERFDDDISFLQDVPIAKMIFHFTSTEMMQRIVTDIKPITDGCLAVSFSSNRYVELNQLAVDKGSGLKKLAEILQVDLAETIAIGDNFNDLSMIETAGLGVCVNNGRSSVKQAAQYVCTADNNHHAIREVLEQFVFNQQERMNLYAKLEIKQ